MGWNILHPSLRAKRIANHPTAWSARNDNRYHLSLVTGAHLEAGQLGRSALLPLLRVLDRDPLYRKPR